MAIFLLILGIVLFIGLILIHEWGHFIAARRGGVEVEEYGVFFPPRLYKRRMKGGWNFTINLIPLGGFVKMKGEHDTDTEPGSYGAADLWTKSKIMVAGVFMNLVTAFVLLMALAWLGMPKLVDNQFTVASDTKIIGQATQTVAVSEVQADSPGAKAGLKTNDVITKIGPTGHEQAITTVESLQTTTTKYAGQTVAIDYTRGNKPYHTSATLRPASDKKEGLLGVGIGQLSEGAELRRSTWSAPIVAGGLIGQFTGLTFVGLGHIFSGLGGIIAGAATNNTTAREHGQTSASSQLGGPILIVYILHLLSTLGYQYMLLIIALISLTLAIMNILPIPALDGGRLWITLVTRLVFKRPLTNAVEERVNIAGFVILFSLSILVAVLDTLRIAHHTL